MREHTTDPQRARIRERALYRYSAALERGDLDGMAAVLQEAQHDPLLEQHILEVNALYQTEYEAADHEHDAAIVRSILQKHLAAAQTGDDEAKSPPLTVGDVAARVQADAARNARADEEALAVSRRLRADATPLPGDLSQRSVREMFDRLGLQVSERFRKLFRETAIFLSMGREQGAMRLAATRRQQQRRKQQTDKEGELER